MKIHKRLASAVMGICLVASISGAQIVKPWEKQAEPVGGDNKFPDTKWFQNVKGYNEALEIQKTTGADIFIYFARYYPSDEKGLCNWFEKRGLAHPDVDKFLRAYIKVKILYPLSKSDEEALSSFRVSKCPAVFIVPPNGRAGRASVFDWQGGAPEILKPDVLIANFQARSSAKTPEAGGGGAAPAPATAPAP